jgi:hypothetical protein
MGASLGKVMTDVFRFESLSTRATRMVVGLLMLFDWLVNGEFKVPVSAKA